MSRTGSEVDSIGERVIAGLILGERGNFLGRLATAFVCRHKSRILSDSQVELPLDTFDSLDIVSGDRLHDLKEHSLPAFVKQCSFREFVLINRQRHHIGVLSVIRHSGCIYREFNCSLFGRRLDARLADRHLGDIKCLVRRAVGGIVGAHSILKRNLKVVGQRGVHLDRDTSFPVGRKNLLAHGLRSPCPKGCQTGDHVDRGGLLHHIATCLFKYNRAKIFLAFCHSFAAE